LFGFPSIFKQIAMPRAICHNESRTPFDVKKMNQGLIRTQSDDAASRVIESIALRD
jgi:predicted GTPase